MGKSLKFALGAVLAISLAACQNPNKVAMDIGAAPAGTAQLRSLEIRRFDTLDEKAILVASTQTLQDLGFTISESSSPVGVLVGSKQRDAHETGQIVGAVVMAALFGVSAATYDVNQTINVTLVTAPVSNGKQIEVRVTFDRLVTDNQSRTRGELIGDAQIYSQFFDKLSSGVSLQGHPI